MMVATWFRNEIKRLVIKNLEETDSEVMVEVNREIPTCSLKAWKKLSIKIPMQPVRNNHPEGDPGDLIISWRI